MLLLLFVKGSHHRKMSDIRRGDADTFRPVVNIQNVPVFRLLCFRAEVGLDVTGPA